MKTNKENKTFVLEQPIAHNIKYYIKLILLPFFDLFFKLVLCLNRPGPTNKKFQVVICGIFKDEGRFLKEWIEYHIIIGVEHFYLYNNFSTDEYNEVLAPYISKGLVTIKNWPFAQGQFSAYKDWNENFRNEAQWVSFLDIDEFICPIYDTSIIDWVNKFYKYPCVVIYWKMFGTSGNIDHDQNRLVTEQYTVSWDKFYSIGKVLYNTDYEIAVYDYSVHHATSTRIKFFGWDILIPPINEFKYFLHWNIHRLGYNTSENFTIQINHYWSKAYMIYDAKTKSSDVAFAISPKNFNYFLAHERHNKSTDYKIFRFMIELKNSMGFIKLK